MKRLLSLVLLVAMVGIAVADVAPERRLSRPLVQSQQLSVNQPGWSGAYAWVMLRFFAPSFWPAAPRYSAPRGVDPEPPVCDVSCYMRPIQGIAE